MKHTEDELVRQLTYRASERVALLRSLSLGERSTVLPQLSPYVQQAVLSKLKNHEIVDLLDHMDMQQAERVVTRVTDPKRRSKIVARLKNDVKEKIEYFLRFHPQATLSLINFNYLFLAHTLTIGETATLIAEHYQETGKYPELLVHDNGELLGEVPLSELVTMRNNSKLSKAVQPAATITYQTDVNNIIETLVSTDSKKIIVLDHDDSVLGLIYADAARSLFGNLPAESLYDFAGVDNSERPFDTIVEKVQHRYQWLILNLATCFLAGSVVLAFQDTLDALTILSVYIPIVAGMGGNAATQSFAVMVRGITLGTVSLQNATPALWREFGAGVINGLIIGALVAVISALWNGQPLFGLVVAVALIGVHVVSAVMGAFVPLFMKHIGKDPAATSTIFITTVTDVTGLLFLLGFSSLFLL